MQRRYQLAVDRVRAAKTSLDGAVLVEEAGIALLRRRSSSKRRPVTSRKVSLSS